MQNVEVFARGVERESDNNLLLGDDCLFLIASLIHLFIGSLLHFFIASMTQSSMTQWLKSSNDSIGESAKGTAPSAARRTVREPLDSHGSPYRAVPYHSRQ